MGTNGETAESIRSLIRIDSRYKEALLAFVARQPSERIWIADSMRFRELVLEEFEQIVKSQEHAERIATADAEAARRAALVRPLRPLLEVLVVPAGSPIMTGGA